VTTRADVRETRWQGEPALALHADGVDAVFVPMLGMTGVSLRRGGREFLATPGGAAALRSGHTMGLPLLAPWANRLARRQFRVGRVEVDLRRRHLHVDENGLPIHGLLVGASGWRVTSQHARGGAATVRGAVDVDADAFPFPHRIEVEFRLAGEGLAVVMLSTELDEHVELMDRVLVFREPELFCELDRSQVSRDRLVAAFFGEESDV